MNEANGSNDTNYTNGSNYTTKIELLVNKDILILPISLITLNKYVCENNEDFLDIDTSILNEYLSYKYFDYFGLVGVKLLNKNDIITIEIIEEVIKSFYDNLLRHRAYINLFSNRSNNYFIIDNSISLKIAYFTKMQNDLKNFVAIFNRYYEIETHNLYAPYGIRYEEIKQMTLVGK